MTQPLGNLKQMARFIKPGLTVQIYGPTECGVDVASELVQFLMKEIGIEARLKTLPDGILIYVEEDEDVNT